MEYVAIIFKHENAEQPMIRSGAITGKDKEAVIAKAIETKHEWEAKGNGPYRIFIGTLTQELKIPVKYKLVDL